MKKYYTLEEAAQKLQLTPDQLRDMYKKKKIQAYPDRGTLQFPIKAIDEEARKRGLGDSDPDLQLGDARDPRKPAKKDDDLLAVDFSIDDEIPLGREKPSEGPRSGKSSSKSGKSSSKNKTAPGSDSEVRLVLDSNPEFNIDLDSDVRLDEGPKGGKAKKDEDSNVRLVPSKDPGDSDGKLEPKPASDSDIRLDEKRGSKKGKDAGIVTEEIDLDAEEEQAKSAVKPRKPKLTQHKPSLPASSPFELSESDIDVGKPGKAKNKAKKAETDSSDDFEVIPFDKAKASDIGSGEIPLLSDDDAVTLGGEIGARKGNSGINLGSPKDDGISLEGSDDEIEFELSLDSVATPKPAKNAKSAKPAKPAKDEEDSSSEFELSLDEEGGESSSSEFELSLDDSGVTDESGSGSDSEFELTLDDEGSLEGDDAKDIFEETNFDVPALDDESGSEAVALDEGDTDSDSDSDFEISLDDSASTDDDDSDSQVVALDDEGEADDEGQTVAKKKPVKGAKPKPGKGAKPKPAARALSESEEDIDIEDSSEGDRGLDLNFDESAPRKRPGKKKKPAAAAGEDEAEDSDPDIETGVELAPPAAPVEWGPLPALLLFPTVVVMFVVGLVGFELIRGMWGYQQSTRVSTPIVDTLSKLGK